MNDTDLPDDMPLPIDDFPLGDDAQPTDDQAPTLPVDQAPPEDGP